MTGAGRRTRVGVTQLTSTPDVEANLEASERVVRLAAERGAELIVLPECFAYLGPGAAKSKLEKTSRRAVRFFSAPKAGLMSLM